MSSRGVAGGLIVLVVLAGCNAGAGQGRAAPTFDTTSSASAPPSSTEPSTASPAPSATTDTSAPAGLGRPDRCHTSQLAATDDGATVAGGTAFGQLVFRNISGQVCTMFGFPGLQRLDGTRHALATQVIRDSSGSGPVLVALEPQQQASAGYALASGCPAGSAATPGVLAELTPPDERDFILIRSGLAPCDRSGTIHVTAVEAGKKLSAAPGAPSPVMFNGTYSQWTWPTGPSALQSLSLTLTVRTDPTPATFFFAHQVGFGGGDGGYVGVQETTKGKIALFSVFHGCDENAPAVNCPPPSARLPLGVPGPSGTCHPLTDSAGTAPEGPGQSCRIPYSWAAGGAYRLTIASAGPGLWRASVIDGATGYTATIGTIRVPSTWHGLRTDSVSWIEYFGPPLTECSALARAQITWGQGQATGSTGGPLGPLSTLSHLGGSGSAVRCPNSSVSDIAGPSPGSVQSMGG